VRKICSHTLNFQQKELSEAKKGYTFGMIPGYGLRTGQFSISELWWPCLQAVHSTSGAELENCLSRRRCLMGHSVNPTKVVLFIAKSPHQITHCTKLHADWCFWCSCNKQDYKNCKATQSKRLTAGLKCWKWLEKRKFETIVFSGYLEKPFLTKKGSNEQLMQGQKNRHT